eukprot:scaffold297893_cov26-Tisochrysis_lutea.AAC.1
MLWHPRDSAAAGPDSDGARTGCPVMTTSPGGDRASCPTADYQKAVSASCCAASYQVDAPGSCPLPHRQGDVSTGWPTHAHQQSTHISCPLYTTFQGSAG